jgi:hypothetical protein
MSKRGWQLTENGEWLKDLLKQRQAREDAQMRQGEYDEIAKSQALPMLRKLAKQVESEINTYSRGGGLAGVRFDSSCFEKGDGFQVGRDQYPTIFLRVQLRPSAAILDVIKTWRASTGAETSRAESTILIVATGPDQIYYRMAGTNYTEEARVSAALLEPLLKFLEDPFSPLHPTT